MARTSAKNAHKVSKKKAATSGRQPIIRGPFDRVRTAVCYDPERGLTHQSFKDECDIHRIVDTYARTGIVPAQRLKPRFGDCPETDLFEAACVQAAIRSAEEEGYESAETASEAPEATIEEKEGSPTGSPDNAAPAASEAADDESRGQLQ